MGTTAATAPTADSEIHVLRLGGAVADIAEDATACSGRCAGHHWVANPVWDAMKDDTVCLDRERGSARQLMVPSMETNNVNEQGDSGSAWRKGLTAPPDIGVWKH